MSAKPFWDAKSLDAMTVMTIARIFTATPLRRIAPAMPMTMVMGSTASMGYPDVVVATVSSCMVFPLERGAVDRI